MKKSFRIIAFVIAIFIAINITAFANAGPGYVEGTDSIGIITQFEKCPITVKNEILTFDIGSPPLLDDINFYYDEWMERYTDKVTAQYTFHNPTEYDVTAKLYFPFGKFSRYSHLYDEEGNYGFKNEKFKNSVLLDGQPVDKKIRFSYSSGEFNAYTEINKLKEDYINHSFFTADLPVTKYVYQDSAYGTDNNEDRNVQLYWENIDNKTAIYVPGRNSWRSAADRAGTFGIHLYKDEEIVVYLFGEKPAAAPDVKGYVANGLTVSLYNISEMTFEQFVLEEYTPWDEETGIPLKDWYNIHADYIIRGLNVNNMVLDMYIDYITYWDELMRWYEYEITIPAGETVINTVAAPLLPAINYEYEPYIYEYTYLLSPAKGWAEFGDIEININTPHYILENSIEGFEKTENGYKYKGNGLPDGELIFELCESDSQRNDIEWAYSIYFLPPFIVCLINIIGFYFLIKNGEKKHKEQLQKEAENEKDI